MLVLLTSATFTLTSCASLGDANALLGKEYFNLGNAYFDLKKYDQAARAYQTALLHAPSLRIATLNLARTKAELGDAGGALALLTPLAAADPENLVIAQQRAWLLFQDGRIEEAATAWLDLSARLPADATTQFNTGVTLVAASRGAEALAPLQRWKELDGQKPDGLLLLAELQVQQNDPASAAASFRAAGVVSSATPDQKKKAARGLALQSEALELFGEAVEAWKVSLELPAVAGKETEQAADWFRLGGLQLLKIEAYDDGLTSLTEAWKAGYRAAEDWDALLANPDLRFGAALPRDLEAAGVNW